MSASQALELRRIARPARYGRGEETVLDRRVRDTWEVARSRVRIDKRRWNRTLIPVIDTLRRDLGLPDSCQLRAELHSILVYEADQFFAPHQDSEKADDMVGTLVVILPSNAAGGELIVRHRGTESVYRSSRSLITFVALYADTVHEVRPLGSGYRVVLTYNLRLAGDSAATTPAVPASALIEAADLVERHFAEPADVAPWRQHAAPGEPPDRLVYLLDHEYTERGMNWSRLKGDDAVRAGVLRSVADELDLEVVPALAEVHEVWDCIEDDWRYRRTRREESDNDFELNDLIDSDVLLHLPGSASSRGMSLDAEAGEHELCESTPSVKLEPYQSEFEGYTGNAGNTMDRWYRRGALVMWPRARAFAVRARGNPAGALDELLAAGDHADLTEIRNRAAMLAPFWANVVRPSNDDDELLVKTMATADLVDDADLAATLIGPFRIESLTPTGALVLVRLAHRYGLGWVDAQLDRWLGLGNRWPVPGHRSRAEWLASLPALCAAMSLAPPAETASSNETSIRTSQLVLERSWTWLEQTLTTAAQEQRPSERHAALESLGPALAGLLEATTTAETPELSATIVTTACGGGTEVLPALTSAVENGHQLEPDVLAASGLADIAIHCARRLEAILAQPERTEGDWSIEVPAPWHTCDDCTVFAAFLADPGRQVLEWPLAERRRRHVHDTIDRLELPVEHTTRRKGSPYTLVLKKGDLVQLDRQARQRAALDLVTALDLLPYRPR
ncbi:MAG: 2OG-Fe(II) oxygenase [Acidimicrobiales bacterium]